MTTPPAATDRSAQLARLREPGRRDLVVIGGGATGLGVALDAAARGFSVVLCEAEDFAKGTSSRATKLVHGGVRYLAQGNVGLVREALRERAALLANAPHLAQPLAFVMPAYKWWQPAFYGAGLAAYGALAGSRAIGSTAVLSIDGALAALPNLRRPSLVGGVRYWDGQFEDARLALAIARTAIARGAVVLNHLPVTGLLHADGKVAGVVARDAETGESFRIEAGAVVNATGVWVDAMRRLDAADTADAAPPPRPMVTPSQGVHLVVDRGFLPGETALIVPKTADGRVLFAVPWLGKTLLGTTDTPRTDLPLEPQASSTEVDFILAEAARYLAHAPRRQDVRSVWAGLRPLVTPGDSERSAHEKSTGTISREHTVVVARSGLVTVTGGKWTTYRAMAEDVIEQCVAAQLLERRGGDVTSGLRLVGAPAAGGTGAPGRSLAEPPGEHLYGTELATLRALPGADRWLWREGRGGFSEAMLRFAVRHEMARTLEDILARRTRLLFLDAAKAEALAGPVAVLLAEELGRPVDAAAIEAFRVVARGYRLDAAATPVAQVAVA